MRKALLKNSSALSSFTAMNKGQDSFVRVLIDDNRLKNFILTRKVVINSSQCQLSMLRDLAHGCGMIALLQKKLDCCILDGQLCDFALLLNFLL